MIAIKRVDTLTFQALKEVGRAFPVLYIFFAHPGVDDVIAEAVGEPQPGEIAIVANYDPTSEVCSKFRLESAKSMLTYSLNCPVGNGSQMDEYVAAVAYARRWRQRNKAAEERGWPDTSLTDDGTDPV